MASISPWWMPHTTSGYRRAQASNGQVRKAMPEALFVFLAPPSWAVLVHRLVGRGTESPEERETRLATARAELAAQDEFDVVVVNHDVEQAAAELVSLMG